MYNYTCANLKQIPKIDFHGSQNVENFIKFYPITHHVTINRKGEGGTITHRITINRKGEGGTTTHPIDK